MYLIDTNICIYALRGLYPHLNNKLTSIHPNQIKVSAITIMELERGFAKNNWGERSINTMWKFLSYYEVLPFTEEDAKLCGQIQANLGALGTPIGDFDTQIAAQAVQRGYTMVTHNTSEFQRVPGIVLEDWAK